MSNNNQHEINVLSFWHQAEFFNSIDISELASNKKGVIHYKSEELLQNSECFPWQDRAKIRRAGKGYYPSNQYSYELYFGVFKRSEFYTLSEEKFNSSDDPDWDERRSDNGLTCSATVEVNHEGIIQFDTVKMSTAPWALGQLLKGNLDHIEFDNFQSETELFLDRWKAMDQLASNLKEELGGSGAFTPIELVEILKQLSTWSGFEPRELASSLIIKLKPMAIDKGANAPENILLSSQAKQEIKLFFDNTENSNFTKNSEQLVLNTVDPVNETEADIVASEDQKVDILNSFFLDDIERARKLIRHNLLSQDSPLMQYLAPKYSRHADLLTPAGEAVIRQQLSLRKTPAGRWPSDSKHTMSLMQQFAINTIKEKLSHKGLYSVNGPPGTGKTTMLRDLVADNVVQRADVLSKLSSAKSAFCADLDVQVGDKLVKGIKQLRPELCGFEMVVVSSNNAAVENITKELPQCKALGAEFSFLEYLKPVAQKLAAKHDEKSNHIYSLDSEDDCWGLIAAALGNSKNRSRFGTCVQFKPIHKLRPVGEQAEHYRTISPAIKDLAALSNDLERDFQKAQQNYKDAASDLEQTIGELELLEHFESEKHALAGLKEKSTQAKRRFLHSKLCLAKLLNKKIHWWSFRFIKLCQQSALLEAFSKRVNEKEALFDLANTRYEEAALNVQNNEGTYQLLLATHKGVHFSALDDDYNSAAIQRISFAHSQKLNNVRACLTKTAFDLHQAWLVACYDGCFAKTINSFSDLINGKVKKYEHAKAMWQCFFMVVPVVSSTFASVARQFSKLRAEDIGWLFIDEAGQATPQQAVGSLMRAQRAVVVGDPLQVEPVFTVAPDFVECFGSKVLGKYWLEWSPTVASVQSIADRVNPYGTCKIAGKHWLGSPLRVHRRCKDPMFTIANTIAYNETMLHALDDIKEDASFVWGPSTWFDIAGEVEDKHFVPAQAEHVLQMLYEFIDDKSELPNCYIITPFRKVKVGIITYLKNNFGHELIDSSQFDAWLNGNGGRVGTVHTFQGKEDELVIFILGASKEAIGAANWASSKPNLLNVALTRAKQRVYVVGCKTLWSELDYFSCAASELSSISD